MSSDRTSAMAGSLRIQSKGQRRDKVMHSTEARTRVTVDWCENYRRRKRNLIAVNVTQHHDNMRMFATHHFQLHVNFGDHML